MKYNCESSYDQHYPEEDDIDIDDFNEIYKPNEFLYEGSSMLSHDFRVSFMWLCNQLKLPVIHRGLLLLFIRMILPPSHVVESTYHDLEKKFINKNKCRSFKICKNCHSIVEKNNYGIEACLGCNREYLDDTETPINSIKYDIKSRLTGLLLKHWDEIQLFKKGI